MDWLNDFWTDHAAVATGLAFAGLAALAWWGDRRRLRRRDPDRVGVMPWTGLFFWATLFACVLLASGVKAWLAG